MKNKKIELIASSADAAFHQAQDGLIFRVGVDATAVQVNQAQATARATFQAICREVARATRR